MRIGIVGGGLMGLGVAFRLSQQGHEVTVLERQDQLGGLSTYHDYGPFTWDRFYHVILPSDRHLLQLLADLGLAEEVQWSPTLTGFFEDQTFYSISSTWEFLRFPLLNLWEKIRLALTLLYCSRLNDAAHLEKVTVEEWLVKMCGRRAFEKFWKPLLLAKMGEEYRRVSAVFIWSYAKRAFSARDASVKSGEQLGHVRGGYRTILHRLEESISKASGECRIDTTVERVEKADGGGLWITTPEERLHFDKVVLTSPVNVIRHIASTDLIDVQDDGSRIEYLGVICMVLLTGMPLVPFYAVNIADPEVPFTGVLGMSSIVPTDQTAGRNLTYLPKYVRTDDPLLRAPDKEIRELFLPGLFHMFPTLKEEDIESIHINRAPRVQPLQVLDYSDLVPRVNTRCEDLFVLNTTQFIDGTVNNNSVIRTVESFVDQHSAAFGLLRRSEGEIASSQAVSSLG